MIRKTTFIDTTNFKRIDKYDLCHNEHTFLSIMDDKNLGADENIALLLSKAKEEGLKSFLPLPKIRPSDEIYQIPEGYFNQ